MRALLAGIGPSLALLLLLALAGLLRLPASN
jgi:hypothetical protein